MKVLRMTLAIAALATSVFVTGCGGSTVEKTVSGASVGKQLEDLKKAYDAGAINQQEYDRARSRILNTY
jgi:hypothetical protein